MGRPVGVQSKAVVIQVVTWKCSIDTDFRAWGRLELLRPVIGWLSPISGLRFKVEEEAIAANESYVEQICNFQGGTNCVF